jgi:hypothetical protein
MTKGKLFPLFIEARTMESERRVEVYHRILLSEALDGIEWQISRSGRFTSGRIFPKLLGPRPSFGAADEIKIHVVAGK